MTCMNAIRLVSAVTATVCLGGCASGGGLTLSTKSTVAGKESVRKVDFRQAPETKELAERARQIGNQVENFVGSLRRNLCRIGHFSTKASTKFATKMQNQHFRNRL